MTRNDENVEGTGVGVDPRLARNGGLSYLEIPVVERRQSAAFYAAVLGWQIDWRGDDDPRFSDQTGHLIGRWVTGRPVSGESGLLPYIYVDHLGEAIEKVAAHGGAVVRAPYPEGNLWIATVRDPAGNVIGLWQRRT